MTIINNWFDWFSAKTFKIVLKCWKAFRHSGTFTPIFISLSLYYIYLTTNLCLLGLSKDFPVHNGCGGDASCHRVDLEEATHSWWLDGICHLTILALIYILSHHLWKGRWPFFITNWKLSPQKRLKPIRMDGYVVPVWSACHNPVLLSCKQHNSSAGNVEGYRWHPAGLSLSPWKT